MQAEKYEPHNIDSLFRREVEKRLWPLADASGHDSQLYDCKEFGLCHVKFSCGVWRAEWFRKVPGQRPPKPRIAVKVTVTDKLGRERRRWQFAMSKLGFLYPVAYEEQKIENGLWTTQYQYRSWHRRREDLLSPAADRVIPDDSVCREAERLYARRKKR